MHRVKAHPSLHQAIVPGSKAPWAELLLKVFAGDVFDCPQCHSRMQRIAWITEAKTIQAILACIEMKERPP